MNPCKRGKYGGAAGRNMLQNGKTNGEDVVIVEDDAERRRRGGTKSTSLEREKREKRRWKKPHQSSGTTNKTVDPLNPLMNTTKDPMLNHRRSINRMESDCSLDESSDNINNDDNSNVCFNVNMKRLKDKQTTSNDHEKEEGEGKHSQDCIVIQDEDEDEENREGDEDEKRRNNTNTVADIYCSSNNSKGLMGEDQMNVVVIDVDESIDVGSNGIAVAVECDAETDGAVVDAEQDSGFLSEEGDVLRKRWKNNSSPSTCSLLSHANAIDTNSTNSNLLNVDGRVPAQEKLVRHRFHYVMRRRSCSCRNTTMYSNNSTQCVFTDSNNNLNIKQIKQATATAMTTMTTIATMTTTPSNNCM
eukprot:m.107414 g.107414  ORF g.107414 m.107414 type:complete len:359 (-) comp12689_c0_seq1:39-1115(-)